MSDDLKYGAAEADGAGKIPVAGDGAGVEDSDGLRAFYEAPQGEVSYTDFTATLPIDSAVDTAAPIDPAAAVSGDVVAGQAVLPAAPVDTAVAAPTTGVFGTYKAFLASMTGVDGADDDAAADVEAPPLDVPRRRRYRAHTAPIGALYRESIKRRAKKRRPSALRYLFACFGGAILGGALTFLGIALLWPGLSALIFGHTAAGTPAGEVVRTYEFETVGSPVEAIYNKVSPSVVSIRVTSAYNDFFFGRQEATARGSGVVIREDGFIITNSRVLSGGYASNAAIQPEGSGRQDAGGAKIDVTLPSEPGTSYAARLVSLDAKTGIAVLKIDASGLTAAELGDSDLLRPGELVVAIGRADMPDISGSVTDGIVSGISAEVSAEEGGGAAFIMTNAAINESNSGGALVDAGGRVVGVNVMRAESPGGGIGYAIPINAVRAVADSLGGFDAAAHGRAKTGIAYSETFSDEYEYYKEQYPDIPKGVYVQSVEPLSGAFRAGIQTGDIVTEFNGQAVTHYNDMLAILDGLAPGVTIPVKVYRGGETLDFDVELSEDKG